MIVLVVGGDKVAILISDSSSWTISIKAKTEQCIFSYVEENSKHHIFMHENWKYDNGKLCIPVHTSPVGLALPAMSVQGILEPSLQQRPCSSLCSHKLAFHIHLSLITDWWSIFTSFILYCVSCDVRPCRNKNFDFGICTLFDVSGCSFWKEYPQTIKKWWYLYIIFVYHTMSVQYSKNFNKGMQILGKSKFNNNAANRSK